MKKSLFGGSEFATDLLSLLPSPCDHLFIFVFFGCASQALWSFVLISLCYPCIYIRIYDPGSRFATTPPPEEWH